MTDMLIFTSMAKKDESARKSNEQWSIPGGQAVPGQLSVDYTNGLILLEIYSNRDIEGNDADILFLRKPVGLQNYVSYETAP